MGVKDLVSSRFRPVERVPQPTMRDVLVGPVKEEITEPQRTGYEAQINLATRRFRGDNAAYEARQSALAAAQRATDDAIIARVRERG